MSILWADFETRSKADLTQVGSYNYSLDASTKVICLPYAFDDEDVQTWLPDQPFPERVIEHVEQGGQVRFHNAGFDRHIWNNVLAADYGVPLLRLEQVYCTAAQARANCAPGPLEDVGRFASANMRKDHRGKQLIRLLCIPRADGTFNDDPELMREMIEYAEQDVRAMRAISRAMRELSPEELADYHVNERINDRGVMVDVALAKAAVRYAERETDEIQSIVAEVTQGEITSVRSPKMREWVIARVGDEAKKLMTVHKDGEARMSIDKSVRANLLILAEENPDEVPPDVAEVVQCADDIWASSVAKFSRMAALADPEDQRVRGALVFAGGSATGRYSSYALQIHNFTRKVSKTPDDTARAMARSHALVPTYGKRIADVLRGMLRPALIAPPGRVFVNLDWSAIEARMLPWLSGSRAAQPVLDAFARGEDIYVQNARVMFNTTEVTPDQRQQAKVAVLACGFAGGVGAFGAMAKNYGLLMSDADKERLVKLWRRANPWAAEMWRAAEYAYRTAMIHRKSEIEANRCTYYFDGLHLWYALPSGRVLCYPYAKFEDNGDITYAKAAWKPSADAKEWPRARLWVGTAVENIDQAASNDVLRVALKRMDAEGLEVVAHTHDEVLVECDERDADTVLDRMTQIMCEPPAWATGLPLAVDGGVSKRYS